MKNIIRNVFPFLTLALMSILTISCDDKKAPEEDAVTKEQTTTFDSTDLKTSDFTGDESLTFMMNYKFTEGESFNYRLTTFTQNEQNIVADSNINTSFQQIVIYLFNFKTVEIDEDSVAEIQCIFTSVNLSASANGKEVKYQSGSKIDSTELLKFAEYESFINNPFNIRATKQGEIVEVFKTDKIVNKFLELRGSADSIKADQKAALNQNISQQLIAPLVSQIFREIPRNKMAKDSSWSQQRDAMPILVFKMDFTNHYKIENIELYKDQKIAVIDGYVENKVEGNPNYSEMGINYVFEKPVSSSSGKIYFNIDRGLVQKSKSQTRMETAYKMEMATPQGTKKGSTREIMTTVNVLELL